MTEGAPRRRSNPQERFIRAMRETATPGFVPFSWTGDRVPKRFRVVDPTDPEKKRVLVDLPVGYMRDGMMFTPDGGPIGSYERVIDSEQQPDGTLFNALLLYPTDPIELEAAITFYGRLRGE